MGYILINGSNRPIIAHNFIEWTFLAISRVAAFLMYPDLCLVFLGKCRALMHFLSTYTMARHVHLDIHGAHKSSGKIIFYLTMIHSIFHMLRWGIAGNIELQVTSKAGLTGFLGLNLMLIVVSVMMSRTLKEALTYEQRKFLHYLCIPLAIALCWHVPASALPWGGYLSIVLGIVVCIYIMDFTYVFFCMTEKVLKPNYQVLSDGVQITAKVSQLFRSRVQRGGYVFVCLPWIDENQWHPFSIYESSIEDDEMCVFMKTSGDWTRSVHKELKRDDSRLLWFCGPFNIPNTRADLYDHHIFVASEIGITPALSTISTLTSARCVNLIWMVSDVDMIRFYLPYLNLNKDGWILMFYTGNEPLGFDLIQNRTRNLKIIQEQPELRRLVLNLIYEIESGHGALEEKLNVDESAQFKTPTATMKSSKVENDETVDLESASFQSSNHDEKREKEETIMIDDMNNSSNQNVDRSSSRHSERSLTFSTHSRRPSTKADFDPCKDYGEVAEAFVKRLADNGKNILQTLGFQNRNDVLGCWKLFFCGDSMANEDILRDISRTYNVDLKVENFNW